MPADFERQMNDRLSQLGDETAGVEWSAAESVRRRGDRRSRNHAVAAATAALLVIGSLGYGVLGGPIPGRDTSSDVAVVEPDQNKGALTSPTTAGTGGGSNDGSDPADSSNPSAPDSEPTESAPSSEREAEGTESASAPQDSNTPSTGGSEETSGDPSNGRSRSGSPDPSVGVATASEDMLLSPDEMPFINNSATWSTAGPSSELGECATGSMEDLGAVDVTGQAYTWSADVTGDHVAGVFSSEEEAGGGSSQYAEWIDGCSWGTPNPPRSVQVDDGSAEYWLIGSSGNGSDVQTEAAAVIQRGEVLTVLTVLGPGQEGPSGMDEAVRAAYDQLPE